MPISRYILDAHEEERLLVRLRNKWMIRIRWYYVVLLTAVAVLSIELSGSAMEPLGRYLALGGAALAANLVLWAATQPKRLSVRYYKLVALVQVLLDLGLASYLIYTQGGLASRAIVLYAIPVLVSGVLFLGLAAYVTAALSTAAYGLTLWLYRIDHSSVYETRDLLVPIAFYGSVLFVLAAVVSRFSTINVVNEREKSYSELLAMLRHQLRNPSGVIAAIVEMLEHSASYAALPQKERWYLQQLKHENLRLNTMITNLLEAAEQPDSKGPAKAEKINLIKLVEETALSCAAASRRMDDLKVNYPIEALMVEGHPQQLAVAFDNIIDNAFRYSEAGTEVTINISKHEPRIEIDVDDRGKGMTKTQQERLFQRFSKYDEEEPTPQLYSLGLGLYVSRVILERHGGRLDIESAPDKGTKVIIELGKARK